MYDNGFSGLFLKISGVVYLILMGDVLLMISTAPIWGILFFTDLTQSWLALALFSPLLAPAIAGAFATFHAFVVDGSTAVVRSFVQGWAKTARKSLMLGVAGAALGVIIVVDLQAFAGNPMSGLFVPGFAVAGALGAITVVIGLALIVAKPGTGRLQALKLGLVCGVRGGLWSLVSLAALGLFAWMLWQHPALGLIAAPAPVLFIVWFDANRALEPGLEQRVGVA